MKRLAILLLMVSACGDAAPPPVTMQWDPGAGVMHVYPDDAFTIDDTATRTGLRLDLTPERIAEVAEAPPAFQDIFRDLSTLDGFGLSSGIIVRFDGKIDPTSLESGEATADPGAPILLVLEPNVRWPYEIIVTDEDQTVILEPMRPLPPGARVYVAVTDRVRTADGRPLVASARMKAVLAGEPVDAVAARVAPRMVAAAAQAATLEPDAAIVGAVVFTTQTVYEDALAIAADVATRDITPLPGTVCTPEPMWIRCEGAFTAVDYRGADGVVEDIMADGTGLDTSMSYDVPFTVWLPLDRPGPYGGTAFPTLIFGHGLGGERQQAEKLALYGAPRGIATIAIDAVMHGAHPAANPMSTSTLNRVLDFFGINIDDLTFKPLRMRDHFRQSSWDKLQLVRMLALGVDLDGDAVVDLDATRLGYLGVSLGGIMGPELLALAPELETGVLVVPGGRVSTIVRDGAQFSVIILAMKPPDATDGDVARFFPILQTLLDRGDAVVWAPHLLDDPATRPAGFPPTARPHLLAGMVLNDDTVPNSANRALARALGTPVVPPVRQEVGLVGVTGTAPVSGNLPDGRTAGLLQFDEITGDGGQLEQATHSNVGDSDVGIEAWFRFLDSWLTDGTPVIVDPYTELGL